MPLRLFTKFDKAVTDAIANKFVKIQDKLISRSEARQIGADVVKEMKTMITRGVSPIRGNGRFPAYKNPKDGYPSTVKGSYPDKRRTPVNLTLTGKQLGDLGYSVTKNGIAIGYSERQAIDKERGHREGVNGQPERPTIPLGTAKGEEFALKIQDIYLQVVQKNIKKL